MTEQLDPTLKRFNLLQDFIFDQLQKDNYYLQEITRHELRQKEKTRLSKLALTLYEKYQEFQK